MRSRKRFIALTALAAATIITLAGCSADGDPVPAEPANGSGSGAPDSSEFLAAAYDGIVGTPPAESVTITPDLHAWIVSCGEISATCAIPAASAMEAAEEIGWQADLCDGKLNPGVKAECIRNGIAAGADVVLVVGDDCSAISGALSEARDAGVTTIAVGGLDCEGDPLFSGVMTQMEAMTAQEWWTTLGELQAKWLIGRADGNAKLLGIEFNDTAWGPWIADGVNAVFAECDTCEVVGSVQLSNADLGTGTLVQKFETALLQNPTANSVAIPIDGWFLAGLGQGIEASGRSADLNVIGAFGSPGNFGLIRDGIGQDATVAMASAWDGWGGIDAALRVLEGQDVPAYGGGLQVVDADNNLPEAGAEFAFNPVIDFRAAYRAAWGL